MTRARKLLLATTAGLAILFAGAARGAPAQDQAGPAPTVATVMADYNTAATEHLKQVSADFNKGQPKGAAPIVYIDYDQVVTWAQLQGDNPKAYEKAIGDYLKAKTGRVFDDQTIEKVFNAMNAQQPAALTPNDGVAGACIVVPEYPGSSFDSYYAAGFQIGDKLLLKDKVVTLNLSSQEFADFAVSHESWHCFDIRYRDDTGSGLAGAVKDNRAEMFADIGGVMERIRAGADVSLIDKIAAERATWVYVTGHARTQLPENDPGRYMSIVYNTHPGLYALKARIAEMGLDNFRKLSRDQMRDLDYEITDAHALNFLQAAGLQGFYTSGKAPVGIQSDVAQLKSIADKSLRRATRQEIAARAAENAAPAAGASLTEQIRSRAAALGDAGSLANQLKARKELTDSLRQKLSGAPAGGGTQNLVNELFLSSPRLPAKGGG